MAFRTTNAEDRFGFSTSGTLRVKCPFEKPAAYAAVALAAIGTLGVFAFIGVVDDFGLFNLLLKSGVSAVWVFICVTLIKVIMTGITLKYSADEKKFHIIAPNKPDEVFYYDDIVELRCTPIRLLARDHGWAVVIRTKYKDITYNYVYTGNKVDKSPEGSPFSVLIERCGLTKQNSGNTIIYSRRTEK